MKSVNTEDISSEEYVIQYFGFGRSILKNSLTSLVQSKLQSQVEAAERHLTSTSLDERLKLKVSEKSSNLLKFMVEESGVILQNLCADLDEQFNIPDFVLLPQDRIFEYCVEQQEVENLRKDIDKLKCDITALNSSQIVMEKELGESIIMKGNITVKEQQLSNLLNGLKAVLLLEE